MNWATYTRRPRASVFQEALCSLLRVPHQKKSKKTHHAIPSTDKITSSIPTFGASVSKEKVLLQHQHFHRQSSDRDSTSGNLAASMTEPSSHRWLDQPVLHKAQLPFASNTSMPGHRAPLIAFTGNVHYQPRLPSVLNDKIVFHRCPLDVLTVFTTSAESREPGERRHVETGTSSEQKNQKAEKFSVRKKGECEEAPSHSQEAHTLCSTPLFSSSIFASFVLHIVSFVQDTLITSPPDTVSCLLLLDLLGCASSFAQWRMNGILLCAYPLPIFPQSFSSVFFFSQYLTTTSCILSSSPLAIRLHICCLPRFWVVRHVTRNKV